MTILLSLSIQLIHTMVGLTIKQMKGDQSMGITLQQAKQLTYGDMIYSNRFTMSDNCTPVRWRVNGQIKRWKRDPDRIQIPVKYGLYDHAYLCHGKINNKVYMKSITLELEDFELTEEAAIKTLLNKRRSV